MNWLQSVSEWTSVMFESVGMSPVALPFALLLGLVNAVASVCCTLPVFGAIAGYAGMQGSTDRRSNFLGASCFMIGTTVALLILGSVAGLIGQVVQSILGQYWKVFAGILAIIVGLAALNLLPLEIPGVKSGAVGTPKKGLWGMAIAGFFLGGAVSVSSLGCNPGLYIILGVAVLQGYTLWMFGILVAYAIGFSLPLAALMLGLSLGKSTIRFRRANTAIRVAAGVVLIGAGFYFFNSI